MCTMYGIFFLISIATTIAVQTAHFEKKDQPIVRTQNGLVRGLVAYTEGRGRPYAAYRGIPYAEPPLGALRFRPPVPKAAWAGVLDATADGSACVQGNFDVVTGSEDCLFVNVYVPLGYRRRAAKGPLAAMVWIHGGTFKTGDSTYRSHGPDFLLEHGVIVVTFNYRLGILGFLTTGDRVVPGNNGLKDQSLALRWVRRNLHHFGGDPAQVTLFGQSAGSASIAYHLQAAPSRGLFQRAIMESGVSLNLWALSRHGSETIRNIGAMLHINVTNSQELVDELRTVHPYVLQKTANSVIIYEYLNVCPKDGTAVGPVIEPDHEGAFISRRSFELLEEGNFSKIPIIIGYNSLEGAIDADMFTYIRYYLLQFDLNSTKLVPVDMNTKLDYTKAVGDKIKKQYFNDSPLFFSKMKFMDYVSDDQFVRPIQKYIQLTSKHMPVHFYLFSYEGQIAARNRTHPGVAHCEELSYIWRTYGDSPSAKDIVTSKRLLEMWTNFAKYGHPTPYESELLQNVIWNPTEADDLTYLEIGNDLTIKSNPNQQRIMAWNQLYKEYGVPPFDTY